VTTCAEAAQSNLWQSGGYIDWIGVQGALFRLYQQYLPGGTYADAQQLEAIVSTLEMLHGPDLAATYPYGLPGFPFTQADVLSMLQTIINAQETPLGNSFSTAGDRGWWAAPGTPGPPPTPRGAHFLVETSHFYLCLRRNRTGLQLLAQSGGSLPVGLEHKLLPSTLALDVTLPGNPSQGGGLVNLQAWVQEMADAGALRPNLTPGLPGPNFWGELIGVVPLYQGMHDQVSRINANFVCPPLETTPMGAALDGAWLGWRERRYPPVLTPPGYTVPAPGFVAQLGQSGPPNPGACDWAGPTNASWPLTTGPGVIDPTAGQDWDCSLHQLARAVLVRHHLGGGFTANDQALILSRLQDWVTPLCENFPLPGTASCSGALSTTQAGYPPAERYVFPPVIASSCEGTVGFTGFPPSPVPSITDILSALLAVVRCGVLPSPPSVAPPFFTTGAAVTVALDMVEACLGAVATLYRTDAVSGWGMWLASDSKAPSRQTVLAPWAELPTGTSIQGAVAALLLAEPFFPGCANASTLQGIGPSGPQFGLGGFLHVFGAYIPALLPPIGSNQLYDWAPAYVPG